MKLSKLLLMSLLVIANAYYLKSDDSQVNKSAEIFGKMDDDYMQCLRDCRELHLRSGFLKRHNDPEYKKCSDKCYDAWWAFFYTLKKFEAENPKQ